MVETLSFKVDLEVILPSYSVFGYKNEFFSYGVAFRRVHAMSGKSYLHPCPDAGIGGVRQCPWADGVAHDTGAQVCDRFI